MYRLLVKNKGLIIILVLVFCLFFKMTVFRSSSDVTHDNRQILQLRGSPDKTDQAENPGQPPQTVAVPAVSGATNGTAPVVAAAAAGAPVQAAPAGAAAPNQAAPGQTLIVKQEEQLKLPSGQPILVGQFPDVEPGVPGISNYLPHLRRNPSLLSPAVSLSKGKMNVSIVIGIPSIRRPGSTYLYDTIKSLIDGMDATERADTLIIVCVTEPWNVTYQREVHANLIAKFSNELTEGLVELIVPKAGYYPDMSKLPLTLGDSPIRVKWRSKQNLDYAFLMTHAWTRGKYYLQLEDDVVASKNYITSMKKAIASNSPDWIILEFSTLGFIGRLFHSESVPHMVEFLLMFYAQKPCDWLMEDYLQVRVCGHGEKWAKCMYKMRYISRPIRPSLFQHQGLRSSLGGKINKLKDKHFSGSDSNAAVVAPTSNPPVANIFTSLKTYANDAYDVYMGERIYWSINAKLGDVIEFVYNPAITVESIIVETGDPKHAGDILSDAVVEVLPSTPAAAPPKAAQVLGRVTHTQAWQERINILPSLSTIYRTAGQCDDAFVTVGKFDAAGKVHVTSTVAAIGPIYSLRIRATAPSKNWVVVSKIVIKSEIPPS